MAVFDADGESGGFKKNVAALSSHRPSARFAGYLRMASLPKGASARHHPA
jgi:hypothetical protein